jgi:hypothetical protein
MKFDINGVFCIVHFSDNIEDLMGRWDNTIKRESKFLLG